MIFLLASTQYEPLAVANLLKPIAKLFPKESAVIKMKLGYYKEAFEICIDQIDDINLA
jgi:hypothetical protein